MSYTSYTLTDDEEAAGVGYLIYGNGSDELENELAGFCADEEEGEGEDSTNVKYPSPSELPKRTRIAVTKFLEEFHAYSDHCEPKISNCLPSPLFNNLGQVRLAVVFQFCLRYFKPYAVARFCKKNKVSKEYKLLAYNQYCPQIGYTTYMLTHADFALTQSNLQQFKKIVQESEYLTAYNRTRAIRNFICEQADPTSKESRQALGIYLGTLRLHFLLQEISLFKFWDSNTQIRFLQNYTLHSFELESEAQNVRNGLEPQNWRKYYFLHHLLYFYPKFVRELYKEIYTFNFMYFQDIEETYLYPKLLDFFSLYHKGY